MNVNGKRTLLVAITLSTFFAAALSYSKDRNRWNMRMVTITPTKTDTKTEPIVTSATPPPADELLPCRTAALSIPTHFEVESQWSAGSSTLAIPYLKNSGTYRLNCLDTKPRLLTSYNDEIISGTIDVKCVDGTLQVTRADCAGKSAGQRADEAAAAAAAEAARLAEEKRKADEAEAARVAAEQAAAAAAAAQAAAAAPCPQNCNGGMGTYTGGSNSKNQSQWKVTYQQCNSGHKIVRSSGKPSSYAVGACYNNIP